MKEVVHGIEYQRPEVYLFNQSGIGTAEFAGRTAYDSFDNSENQAIVQANESVKDGSINAFEIFEMNNIESSELLDSLAWVHHHHSVIEHVNLSYLIKGTSRGVLQEHARHRIQSLTVRSTRYTMSNVVNAFIATILENDVSPNVNFFLYKLLGFDMFVTYDSNYNRIIIEGIFEKMLFQYNIVGKEAFIDMCVSKDALNNGALTLVNPEKIFNALQNSKKKRNVGDAFKHIVDDNWKVDLVCTFNLRALKNYFDLRDSGGAFFQIRWLAEAMKEVTPKMYLRLIDKKYKDA